MIANIWNLRRVVPQLFHRDHCQSVYSRIDDPQMRVAARPWVDPDEGDNRIARLKKPGQIV